MKLGIVGLPNVGKSTLFNALTKLAAEVANFPFTTINPNVGIVTVFDERLEKLSKIIPHEKLTFTTVEFVDIAGLVKGASKGEGLGNQFLSHIREVDGILHVVRCFEDENTVHVSGSVDPVRDAEIINTELLLADLEHVEKGFQKIQRLLKTNNKKVFQERDMLQKIKENLNKGIPVRLVKFEEHEAEFMTQYFFLTSKPVLYLANVNENKYPGLSKLKEKAAAENSEVVEIMSKLELEMCSLTEEECKEFGKEYGINEAAVKRLVKAAHALLGLITFFTVKEPEIRSWSILKDTKAPKAAGKIHSDMERGFISAEVINTEALLKIGSWSKARAEGALALQGKEYLIKDGDVVQFRFGL